jgi:hypothetical protein
MITDTIPRKASLKQEYQRSDDLRRIPLPDHETLRTQAHNLEEALARDSRADVQAASRQLISALAEAYRVPVPEVKVLGARPRKVTEYAEHELFGDYDPETARIRLWARTAILKKPTSFGTFLSTLCHEFCHHLDVVSLGLPNTFHTRGFYERAGALYHHVRGTPARLLVWVELPNGTFRINWAETMRRPAR